MDEFETDNIGRRYYIHNNKIVYVDELGRDLPEQPPMRNPRSDHNMSDLDSMDRHPGNKKKTKPLWFGAEEHGMSGAEAREWRAAAEASAEKKKQRKVDKTTTHGGGSNIDWIACQERSI